MDVVCDIGGTNMRVAGVVGGTLAERRHAKTPEDPTEGIAVLVRLASECAQGESIASLMGCISADTIGKDGVLADARNLPLWEGHDVVGQISRNLHAPVTLKTDVAVVGLGETMFGAGRGAESVAYVTVSTGVGCALIRNNSIEASGADGRIKLDGVDLEYLISGTAVYKKFGIHPKDFVSPEERGKLGDMLARGLQILAERWEPEVFVLGGSMILGANAIPLDRASLLLKAPIRTAELGDLGGLYGGLALLRQSLEG